MKDVLGFCADECLVEQINSGQFNSVDGIRELSEIFGKQVELHEITTEILDEAMGGDVDLDDMEDDFQESLATALAPNEEGYESTFLSADSNTVSGIWLAIYLDEQDAVRKRTWFTYCWHYCRFL